MCKEKRKNSKYEPNICLLIIEEMKRTISLTKLLSLVIGLHQMGVCSSFQSNKSGLLSTIYNSSFVFLISILKMLLHQPNNQKHVSVSLLCFQRVLHL